MAVATADKLVTLEDLNAAYQANAHALYLNRTTWSAIYAELSKIPQYGTATFIAMSNPAVSSVLTGGAITAHLEGTVTSLGSGYYDFMAMAGYVSIATWRISGLTSADATPTISNVTKYFGGTDATAVRSAIGAATSLCINTDASNSTWAEMYARLSTITDGHTATFWAGYYATMLLTGNKFGSAVFGTVIRNGSNYSFLAAQGSDSGVFIKWLITDLTSASATPTVHSVYRLIGTAI